MGCGAHSLVDESISPHSRSLGEESRNLYRHAPLCAWHHYLESNRPTEIGSYSTIDATSKGFVISPNYDVTENWVVRMDFEFDYIDLKESATGAGPRPGNDL